MQIEQIEVIFTHLKERSVVAMNTQLQVGEKIILIINNKLIN